MPWREWFRSHRRMAGRPRGAGYTLIDLIVAVTILSLGLGTVLTSLAGMGQRQVFNESTINAAMMAQAVMERAINKGYANVSSLAGTGQTYDATYYPNYTYDLNVVYVNSTDLDTSVVGPTDYRRVEVKIYHAISGSTILRAQLRTILTSGT